MKKCVVSLLAGTLFTFAVFAMPVKAEYVTVGTGQIYFDSLVNGVASVTATLDFSEWSDSFNGNSVEAAVSLGADITTRLAIIRGELGQDRDLGGEYNATILATLNIEDTHGGSVTVPTTNLYHEQFTIEDETYLYNLGDEYFSNKQTTIGNDWVIDIVPYLDENYKLTLNFAVESLGFVVGSTPDGYRSGIDIVNYDTAAIFVQFEIPDTAVPEPATLLIFGIVTAIGLPLLRRRIRKK
jgi:hypothetical protein